MRDTQGLSQTTFGI